MQFSDHLKANPKLTNLFKDFLAEFKHVPKLLHSQKKKISKFLDMIISETRQVLLKILFKKIRFKSLSPWT
jgi:hypothetical protein